MSDVITLDCIKRLREWLERTPEERCAAGEHNVVAIEFSDMDRTIKWECLWCGKHEETRHDAEEV